MVDGVDFEFLLSSPHSGGYSNCFDKILPSILLSSPHCGGYSEIGALNGAVSLLSSPHCGGHSYLGPKSYRPNIDFLPRIAGVIPKKTLTKR